MPRKSGGTVSWAVEGDLDIFSLMDQAGRVQVLLDPARGLAIDLSRLGDLDPAGLQLLLSLRISCSARNQPFQVTGLAAELGDRLLALGVKDFVPGSNP